MEDREATITRFDAKRLLPPWDFAELEDIRRAMDQRHRLAPWAERRYDQLLEKVKKMMLREHAEMLAEEYVEKLKEDDFSLEELSDGWAVSSRQEAIEFLTKAFPDFEKILLESDSTDWLPGCIPKIRDMAELCVKGVFEGLMGHVGHPEAFDYKTEIWPFVAPHLSYAKLGVDCLEFCLRPFAIYSIKIHRSEHDKNFRGWVTTYPAGEAPLCLFTETLDPSTLDMTIPKITVPVKLILGLASGNLQPDGCEVIRQKEGILTYAVEGFMNEITLSHNFMTFIMKLGENPLRALRDLGLLGEITLRILTSKKEDKSLELPVIREKDRNYLRKINEIDDFLTFGGWGEALELTKQGADALLKRLEGEEAVSTIRHESGEGIRASLTALGLAILRQIPEFDG